MRRLLESGIITILLLGLTGCAGVQPRLGRTEAPALGDESSEDRPLSRLAFWRRHQAEEASASDVDSGRSSLIAGKESADDEDRPGLLRRLPLVSQLWKNEHRDESAELDMPAARYAPGVLGTRAVAANGPTRAPIAAGSSTSPAPAPAANSDSTVADTKPAATNPAPSATTASAEADRLDEPPAVRELTVDLAGTKPEVDTAAVPARNPGPPQIGASGNEAAPPPPPLAGSQPQQRNPSTAPTAPSGTAEAVPSTPSAAPGPQPATTTPDLTPSTPSPGPSLSAPTMTAPPESWTPTVISTPGPTMPLSGEVSYSGSGQSLVMSSPQGGYISGGCEEGCGAKCKIHKLCPLKKHKQAIASSAVYPSAQGMVSSCEASAPCKVKKECFLKKWLHHKGGCKIKGCKGCKSCAYCGEPPVIVSAQSPLVSPQW